MPWNDLKKDSSGFNASSLEVKSEYATIYLYATSWGNATE